MNAVTCAICQSTLSFRWTDTHGVGVCCTCGAPYTILHYDPETKERIDDREPELALTESGRELGLRYWREKKRMVFPAVYDMGFSARREGRSYSGATEADDRAFQEWLKDQPESKATGATE